MIRTMSPIPPDYVLMLTLKVSCVDVAVYVVVSKC